MGCCRTLSKMVLVVFNAIFALVGIALAAVGGVCLFAFDTAVDMVSKVGFVESILEMLEASGGVSLIKNSAIFLLVLGIFLLILSMLGLCGALKDTNCLLAIFAIVMGIILAAQLALVLYAVIDRDGLQSNIQKELAKTIPKYEGAGLQYINGTLILADENSDQTSFAWDYMHLGAGCCGVNGTADWSDTFNETYTLPGISTSTQASFPLSCCKPDDASKYPTDVASLMFHNAEECLTAASDSSTNTKGCVPTLFDEVWKFGEIVIGSISGILGLQLLEIICALSLICCGDGSKAV